MIIRFIINTAFPFLFNCLLSERLRCIFQFSPYRGARLSLVGAICHLCICGNLWRNTNYWDKSLPPPYDDELSLCGVTHYALQLLIKKGHTHTVLLSCMHIFAKMFILWRSTLLMFFCMHRRLIHLMIFCFSLSFALKMMRRHAKKKW